MAQKGCLAAIDHIKFKESGTKKRLVSRFYFMKSGSFLEAVVWLLLFWVLLNVISHAHIWPLYAQHLPHEQVIQTFFGMIDS